MIKSLQKRPDQVLNLWPFDYKSNMQTIALPGHFMGDLQCEWQFKVYRQCEWHCKSYLQFEWHFKVYLQSEWHGKPYLRCQWPFKVYLQCEWHCELYFKVNNTVRLIYSTNEKKTYCQFNWHCKGYSIMNYTMSYPMIDIKGTLSGWFTVRDISHEMTVMPIASMNCTVSIVSSV